MLILPKLGLDPFLAFRSVHQLTYENGVANREYQEVENGIKTCMYEGILSCLCS